MEILTYLFWYHGCWLILLPLIALIIYTHKKNDFSDVCLTIVLSLSLVCLLFDTFSQKVFIIETNKTLMTFPSNDLDNTEDYCFDKHLVYNKNIRYQFTVNNLTTVTYKITQEKRINPLTNKQYTCLQNIETSK